ncbi:hypothetical protein ABZ858_11390 [Streptomyces sp. NPDC047017]|uniref:hypothetical protein n=1 Tax=Streptomyces sp. NPDC047017 TaxID=3155024 RepID=UPI0033ED49EE
MISGRKERERSSEAVTAFETAVHDRDGDRSTYVFQEIHRTFGQADDGEHIAAGPRLAALLPQVPPGEADGAPDAPVVERVGPEAAQGRRALPQWEMASVAMLTLERVLDAEQTQRLLARRTLPQ